MLEDKLVTALQWRSSPPLLPRTGPRLALQRVLALSLVPSSRPPGLRRHNISSFAPAAPFISFFFFYYHESCLLGHRHSQTSALIIESKYIVSHPGRVALQQSATIAEKGYSQSPIPATILDINAAPSALGVSNDHRPCRSRALPLSVDMSRL